MPLPRVLSQLFANNLVRNVALLASGTIVGQAIMVLILPLLTRIYEPSAFGLLGVYMALVMVLSVGACFRFDLAIPLPDDDADGVALLVLGTLAATGISAVLALFVWLAPDLVVSWLEQPEFLPFLWMVPLGVWLAAVYSAVQLWSIRMKRFGPVAQTQLVRAIGGGGSQLGMGLAGFGASGLLLGHMIYTGLGTAGLLRLFARNDVSFVKMINLPRLRRVFYENRRFPMFSVPESLLNSAAINLPIILIASIAGAKEAGFMLLALRVTSIPVGLLGASLSRVFLSEAAQRRRDGDLGAFTRLIMRRLLQLGIVPFLILAFASPMLFSWVFGTEWARAGVMVSWMAPFMMMQFIVSPVSTSLHASGNQFTAFILQLFGFILLMGTLFIASVLSPANVFEWFSIASFVYYSVYVAVVLRVSFKLPEEKR